MGNNLATITVHSNNFSQFNISIFVADREKPTHTKICVNLDFAQTYLTMLYCYLIGIPWLLILRMTQISYFLPFTIKLIRLLKSMYHWHHKQVIDHTLEPSSAVYKFWVVGKRNCSFSTHWLISIYDLFPPPNISGFIAEWVGASAEYRDVTGLNPVEVLTFSGFYTHKCINCFHNWEDHSLLDFTSAVQDMKFFIYNFTFIPHGLLRTHKWPVPNVSGFIAQLVRASHHYCKVTGSNPVEVLTFPGF